MGLREPLGLLEARPLRPQGAGLVVQLRLQATRNLAQAVTLKHQLGDMTPSERRKVDGMMRDTRSTIAMLEEVLRMAEREEAAREREETHAATIAATRSDTGEAVCPRATQASPSRELPKK